LPNIFLTKLLWEIQFKIKSLASRQRNRESR
jgi:hypothetical protein